MVDWATIASLATAGGTLVLALATFAAVRSANRSARLAEYSMKIGIRPLLMPSRLEDVSQKIMWGDERWALLEGAGAHVEIAEDNIYLAMSIRNAGSGIGVIQGWHLGLHELREEHPHAEPDESVRRRATCTSRQETLGSGKPRSVTAPMLSTPPSWRP